MDAPEPVLQSELLFKRRPLKHSSIRKRPTTPLPAPESGSDYSSSDDCEGPTLKRQRRNGLVTVSSKTQESAISSGIEATKFDADRSAQIQSTNDATKQSNWFDENGREDMSAKSLLGTTRSSRDAPSGVDGTGAYKGAANYQSFVQKNPNAPTRQIGPIKAPTNIRTITVTDFAPDVCKDFKQTGFCGFGDSCKFLHAREDYKQGWELDRDWEIGTKGKKIGGKTIASANRSTKSGDGASDDDDELLEGIPFACVICKKPYTNPIITKCGHYFCEACALQRYRKSPSCAACGAGTGGVFNGAKNLRKLLDKKRERAKSRKKKALENGEEISDDDIEEVGNID
ncbi:RNA-splicing factor [Acarospora aff. strigata]|nr:RNA-splicing factor [Acarospora aff. strigata]